MYYQREHTAPKITISPEKSTRNGGRLERRAPKNGLRVAIVPRAIATISRCVGGRRRDRRRRDAICLLRDILSIHRESAAPLDAEAPVRPKKDPTTRRADGRKRDKNTEFRRSPRKRGTLFHAFRDRIAFLLTMATRIITARSVSLTASTLPTSFLFVMTRWRARGVSDFRCYTPVMLGGRFFAHAHQV